MGNTQSAQTDQDPDPDQDQVQDQEQVQDQDQDQDSTVEDKLLQNNGQISGLRGKPDDPLAELKDHLKDEVIDEVCDTESALVSAREEVSETFETVDDKEVLLEDVEINDRTDSDPNADEAVLNEKEDRMNEINKSFRRFFSNIGLRLTVKQDTDEQQAETASDELPNGEEEPSSPGDTCDTANKSTSETGENNADHHMAQDSADNESTTCPTVTDMTSEDIQENVEDKTTAATEVEQKAAEETLAHADTEDGTTSGAEPEASPPQDSAEEEVMSPIKVFFTTGIFSNVDDLTEFISKLQQLSDIPEEGLIEESIATPASFAEDAARDDTIADIMEFTSEAVTAPEPIDITAEDETEMVSATSQLTSSSKTSGNTTPVPAEYDVIERDDLLHQVVETIFATPDEALIQKRLVVHKQTRCQPRQKLPQQMKPLKELTY
ncbi:unnamed protein product [Merluccius merluccius]